MVPHYSAYPLEIAKDDALAFEKVGFYVEETKPVVTASHRRRETERAGIERDRTTTGSNRRGWD